MKGQASRLSRSPKDRINATIFRVMAITCLILYVLDLRSSWRYQFFLKDLSFSADAKENTCWPEGRRPDRLCRPDNHLQISKTLWNLFLTASGTHQNGLWTTGNTTFGRTGIKRKDEEGSTEWSMKSQTIQLLERFWSKWFNVQLLEYNNVKKGPEKKPMPSQSSLFL